MLRGINVLIFPKIPNNNKQNNKTQRVSPFLKELTVFKLNQNWLLGGC